MDVIFEILVEIYMELMFLIVPEDKEKSKKKRLLAIAVAFLGMAATVVSFVFGISMIADQKNMMGIIPLAVAVLLSVVQIAAGISAVLKRK